MKRVRLLGILIPLFWQLQSRAQDNRNAVFVNFIEGPKAFSTYSKPLMNTFNGIEAGFRLNMRRDSVPWVKTLRIEDISFEASRLDLNNIFINDLPASAGSFGYSYNAIVALDIRMFRWNRITFIFSPGGGLSYTTKYFKNTGYNNFIIGSRGNFVVRGKIGMRMPLMFGFDGELAVNTLHASDCEAANPNCGFNGITVTGGISKSLSSFGPKESKHSFTTSGDAFDLDIDYGSQGGATTGYWINPITGNGVWNKNLSAGVPGIPQIALSASFDHRLDFLNGLVGLKIGSDIMWTSKVFNGTTDASFLSSWQDDFTSHSPVTIGGTIGADIWLGRLVFSGSYGRYIFERFLLKDNTSYIVFSARYFVSDHLALNAKAFLAHFPAGGLSYRF
ncbi:MAG TPA: hypothetical protein VL576_02630 [Candidatus Paceibacterota bacterium]|jgi:hypothetical protein|nr:hypothetical protein [Candidatus Paceibacterota bacterium]